ncbi:MAG: hypothetical protein HY290_24130, partial [Planctomycetia bacterium]|nr:hypothetical protein [Planctomycetia bacterium]
MRCGLLLVALLGLTWGNRLAAQEAPRKPQGLGQLVVIDPQSGSPVRLNLARYHVNIVLQPPVALVQIDQSFFNPFATQQEGTFVFNLPAGASVSRFAMYTTPTQLIEGELLERKNASSIYQSIVTRRRDPAILEQIGGNLFKMRVFPIFARDTKRILLDFTLPIAEQEGGFYTFELPLMSDLEPVWDFAVQGTIRGPNVAGTARCDSHDDVKFVDAGDDSLKFRFAAQKYRPESAFSLKFQQRQSDAVVIRSYTPAPIGGGVPAVVQPDKIKTPPATQFLATVSPAALEPIARAAAAKSAPADVLILADTSGGTTAHGRLRQGIRAICGDLRDEDRFALGCVDVDFRPLTRGWVAPRSQAADQALADFNREVFLGATDLVQSFKSALKSLPPAEPGRRRLIVYVGDGELAVKGPSMLFVQQAIADGLLQAGVRFSVVLHRGGQTAGAALEKPIAATGGRLLQIDAGGSFAELSEWVRAG